jgi:hypothetical protein
MLSCKKVTELCSQEFERKLNLGERAAMSTHIVMCAGCSNFRRQLRVLRGLARTYAEGNAPSARAEESGSDAGRSSV